MNRKEAADFLGVSEKSVSRYVSSGRLGARRAGGSLDITQDELAAFQAQMSVAVPLAADEEQDETSAETRDRTGQGPLSQANEEVSLAPSSGQTGAVGAGSLVLVLESADAVRELAETLAGHGTGQDRTVPLFHKKTLSLPEAARLSGVAEYILRAATRDGQLRAVKIGRGMRVLPADLDVFVQSLFNGQGPSIASAQAAIR